MSRCSIGFVLVMVAMLMGCQGDFSHSPGNVEVRLAVEPDRLEVLDIQEVGELPNPPVDGEPLQFAFHPADGSEIIIGEVEDPRILRTEFDENGDPDPKYLISDIGLLDVRVPNVAGELVLSRGETGETLGRVEIDPAAPITRTQPLLNSSDVLGPAVKIVDHGPSSSRADILFLSEGYTEAELSSFHQHVNAIVAELSMKTGYREHWSGFNVWRQDVRSLQSGTDDGVDRQTAFDTGHGVSGVQRCVFFKSTEAMRAAKELGRQAGADVTVVLVNSTQHGGCASDGVVVSARPRMVADVVAHEIAHGLFGLADEYTYAGGGDYCSTGPNVAASPNPSSLPWADMLTTNNLPTPVGAASAGTIGAFEGAGYCSTGRYRPTHDCMMRTIGKGMCPVCQREVARTMQQLGAAGGGGGTGQNADASAGRVEVTNATGAGLWVRCDGANSATCSDWTYLQPGDAAAILTPGRRLVLDNRDWLPEAPFRLLRVRAPADRVAVYANATDPFTQPNTGKNDSGSSQNTGGQQSQDQQSQDQQSQDQQGSSLQAPQGLGPDGVMVPTGGAIDLSWNAVAGATSYVIAMDYEGDWGWESYYEWTTRETTKRVWPQEPNRNYRWRVMACNSTACSWASAAAYFYYGATSQGGSDGAGTNGTLPPSTPWDLKPGNESRVTTAQVALQWSGPSNATQYEVDVRYWDAAGGQWLPAGTFSSQSTSFGVAPQQAEIWYAWGVRACNAAGCSPWSEFAIFYFAP